MKEKRKGVFVLASEEEEEAGGGGEEEEILPALAGRVGEKRRFDQPSVVDGEES